MWSTWGRLVPRGTPPAFVEHLPSCIPTPGVVHNASVSDCLPLAAPIGLSPPLILTLCGPERILVVSTEPPDDLSCLTTSGVGRPGDGAVARAVDQMHPEALCQPPPLLPLPHSNGHRLWGHSSPPPHRTSRARWCVGVHPCKACCWASGCGALPPQGPWPPRARLMRSCSRRPQKQRSAAGPEAHQRYGAVREVMPRMHQNGRQPQGEGGLPSLGPPPPHQRGHRGKNRYLPLGKSGRAVLAHTLLGPRPPPLPPPLLTQSSW